MSKSYVLAQVAAALAKEDLSDKTDVIVVHGAPMTPQLIAAAQRAAKGPRVILVQLEEANEETAGDAPTSEPPDEVDHYDPGFFATLRDSLSFDISHESAPEFRPRPQDRFINSEIRSFRGRRR